MDQEGARDDGRTKEGRKEVREAEAASSPSSSSAAAASLLSEDATTKVGPTDRPARRNVDITVTWYSVPLAPSGQQHTG